MRKLILTLLCVTLVVTLALSVSAGTASSKTSVYAAVGNDGACQVSIHVSLRLEQVDKNLTYPVPHNATAVCLNGTRVSPRTINGVRQIDLSKSIGSMVGEFNFTVSYNIKDVVTKSEAGTPQLEIPMLSGFAYPIELLEFSVTIPGDITAKPAFSSGYHQASIEQSLSASASGNTITGYSLKNLKDHETLVMTLDVPEDMFPRSTPLISASLVDDIGMITCGALALLYWLLTLRTKPLLGQVTDLPPGGFSAGEMGSLLTLQGADLNMMVFSWARLGYILIQQDRNKRVFLHKRMEMGNERSGFEQRCFNNLFAGKKIVDTSGYRYAILCQKCNTLSPEMREQISRKSGNGRIFRILAAGVGLFGGMAMAFALVSSPVGRWLLTILLASLGAYSAWIIQKWADCLLLLDKAPIKKALIYCFPWLLLSLIGDVKLLGVIVPVSQLLAGLMAAFGGRRTEEGQRNTKLALGLRRYLKSLDQAQAQRLTQFDPDYFHNMAPYALAFGVDREFAKAFGKNGIPACSYLTTGMDGHRSASEWSGLLRSTHEAMTQRQKQLRSEGFQKLLSQWIK